MTSPSRQGATTALMLVTVGGAIGSLVRHSLAESLPNAAAGWPWATLATNVAGSFLLGFLLGVLSQQTSETVTQIRIRLSLGTGMLGGFTTYSTLALELQRFAAADHWNLMVGYGSTTLLLGVGAATLGIAVAHAHCRRRRAAKSSRGATCEQTAGNPA